MTESMEREEQKRLQEDLINLLKENKIDAFREEFLEMHPYDQGQFFEELDEDLRFALYEMLSPEEMADIFEQVEVPEEDYQER